MAYQYPTFPGSCDLGRQDVVLFPGSEQLAADHAGQPGPAEDRQDDGDPEVHLNDRPHRWQGRAQCHPQRDLRDVLEKLDDALDDHVGGAAEVARYPAQETTQDETDRDTHQADAQRHARGVENPGQHVPADALGTQQVDHAGLVHAEEVDVAGNETEQLVVGTADKEPHRVPV